MRGRQKEKQTFSTYCIQLFLISLFRNVTLTQNIGYRNSINFHVVVLLISNKFYRIVASWAARNTTRKWGRAVDANLGDNQMSFDVFWKVWNYKSVVSCLYICTRKNMNG